MEGMPNMKMEFGLFMSPLLLNPFGHTPRCTLKTAVKPCGVWQKKETVAELPEKWQTEAVLWKDKCKAVNFVAPKPVSV